MEQDTLMSELSPTVRHFLTKERKALEVLIIEAQKQYEDAPRRIQFLKDRLYDLQVALGET